jgi:Zn-dependent protease with chaperone function
MSAVTRALFLAALPMAWAQTPAVTVQAHIEPTGEVYINGISSRTGTTLSAPVLAAVMNCKGKTKSAGRFDDFQCKNALRREGLSLEAVLDLAPITRMLLPSDEIQLWLEYPRLGFEASSAPLKDEGGRWRVTRTARFTAAAAPGPIRIQFGYHLDQLAAIYLPLVAMALALAMIAMALSKAGHADLNRALFMLGTMFWLAAATELHASVPFRILLSGTPLANVAGALVEYLPPLLCIAAGTALGSRKQTERTFGELFAEVFWSFGTFLFPLATAITAVTSMTEGDWLDATPWLVVAPLTVFICRWRMRASAAVSVRQLSSGELKDRVSELAAKTGRHDVRIFISFSARSQVFNAFALLRNGILMTAPLVQSLTRREVDAVAAHELSHFGHVRRSPLAGLAIAVVVCKTPLADVFLQWSGGLLLAMLIPAAMFFAALRGARKREFLADSGSVALTGDPRAMISALARISRHNKRPIACNPVVEFFSTHPSTKKRIRALAVAARLETAEVETLCNTDDAGAGYPIPPEDGGAIFSLAWQTANASRYVWTALCSASAVGLLIAGMLDRFAVSGFPQLLCAIALGCAITKVLSATVMSWNYARLRRKLASKLGVTGQLVGLAADGEPRLYNGYRFSDAGLLSFHGGRLCYRSERTTIQLNPADVLEVSMVAASPSSWRRLQPMVRFRRQQSSDVNAFILHPVEWLASPRRLHQSIERWRAESTSAEPTSISGLNAIPGQPFYSPTISATMRGFRIPGAITLVGAILAGWIHGTESWLAWYALAITASAYLFMYLPAMLYRQSSHPPPLTPRVDTD